MASALLNNMSLMMLASLPTIADGEEISDEATQILFGVLDDLQKEKSQVCVIGASHVSTLCRFFQLVFTRSVVFLFFRFTNYHVYFF